MPDIASSLLSFILDLLRDPAAARSFAEDPDQALADAGLSDVDAADVLALEPAVADQVPAVASGTEGGWHGARSTGDGHAALTAPAAAAASTTAEPVSAVEQLQVLQATYSYTDHSVSYDYSHDVWATGDVYQVAGNGNVIGDSNATGAGAATHDTRDQSDNGVTTVTVGDVASGNDSSDNSVDNSVDSSDHSVDASDNSVNSSDNSVTIDDSDNSVDNSDNSDSSDNSVDNSDNSVDESDNSVWTDDSDNSVDSSDNSVDESVDDSFDDNDLSDNSVDSSDHSDNSVTDHAAA